jgi:hypothetical protein
MNVLRSQNPSALARIAVFTVGLTMLLIGLLRGEALFVLKRAITICLECIGIG